MTTAEFITIIATGIGTSISIVGLLYAIIRNFKNDVNSKIEKLEDRMFYLATGKSLADAIKEDRMKSEKLR